MLNDIKSGVDSALSVFDPLIDLGNGIYRAWAQYAAEKAITGNRVIVKIGGNTVGLIQTISISANIEQQRLYGIGDVTAVEIVPGDVEYQINGSKMMIPTRALMAIGLIPDDEDWLSQAPLQLELIDKITAKSVMITGCKFTNYTIDATAHRILLEKFTMTAQRMSRVNWRK